jgi:hypothetical protein
MPGANQVQEPVSPVKRFVFFEATYYHRHIAFLRIAKTIDKHASQGSFHTPILNKSSARPMRLSMACNCLPQISEVPCLATLPA